MKHLKLRFLLLPVALLSLLNGCSSLGDSSGLSAEEKRQISSPPPPTSPERAARIRAAAEQARAAQEASSPKK